VSNLIDDNLTQLEIGQTLALSQPRVSTLLNHFGLNTNKSLMSTTHKEIYDFMCSMLPSTNITTNDRTIIPPHELDIYIPELNIAIEVNGVYWHGELAGRPRTYHKSKMVNCNIKGIKLIHIWNNEWNEKREIVKSRLSHICNMVINRVFARQLSIITVSTTNSKQFLIDNHIQGYVHSTHNYGLTRDGELLAIMTIGKSRYNTQHEYELLRFCTKRYVQVVGGASRLLHHFIKINSPNSIISYSDLRWGNGNVYSKLQFTHIRDSTPNYFYFKRNNTLVLRSRQSFQKHKLQSKLELFDPKLTEWENMINNGYDRIWDCGNGVWSWNKK
jgi:hypothetical protein